MITLFSFPVLSSKSDMQSQLIEHAARYTDSLTDHGNDEHGHGTWNDAAGVPTTSQKKPHPSLVNPRSPPSMVRHKTLLYPVNASTNQLPSYYPTPKNMPHHASYRLLTPLFQPLSAQTTLTASSFSCSHCLW